MDAVSSQPKAPGDLRLAQRTVEMQQPATIVIFAARVLQHTVINITIQDRQWARPFHRRVHWRHCPGIATSLSRMLASGASVRLSSDAR